MKSSKLSMAIATGTFFALAGSNVFAGDVWLGELGDNWQQHIVSTKTRAQVIAEVNEAHAQGLIHNGDVDYPQFPAMTSNRTREEVRAEAADAAKYRLSDIEYSSGQ